MLVFFTVHFHSLAPLHTQTHTDLKCVLHCSMGLFPKHCFNWGKKKLMRKTYTTVFFTAQKIKTCTHTAFTGMCAAYIMLMLSMHQCRNVEMLISVPGQGFESATTFFFIFFFLPSDKSAEAQIIKK